MAKRGRKPNPNKKREYFSDEEEMAVIMYLKTEDYLEKNRIYNEILKPAFEKMAESIIRRYKLYVPEETFEETFNDALSFIITKADKYRPIIFSYKEVEKKYLNMLEWLAGVYVNVLNAIHYMHDKYYYEAAELALEDTDVKRTFATGIAGFSHVVDSLCAMKYAKVKVNREEVEVKDKAGNVIDKVTLVRLNEIRQLR